MVTRATKRPAAQGGLIMMASLDAVYEERSRAPVAILHGCRALNDARVVEVTRHLMRQAIRGTMRQDEAIRGDQRGSEVIRGDQRSSEVIRGHQRSSEVIRGHQVRRTGTIDADAFAEMMARNTLKPMPASSWCHMCIAAC